MNNQNLPALRQDFQLGPLEEDPGANPNSQLPIKRILRCFLKFWWIPVLTLVLAIGAGAAFVRIKPPTYVSKATMWETVKLRLPEGAIFSEDVQNFLGTQTELLKSSTLRDQTIARLKDPTNGVYVPTDANGDPLEVDIRVSGSSKSSVFLIQATSSHSSYTRSYLNELMKVYLEYKKNSRAEVSGGTLASITAQVERAERDLKAEQDALNAFQKTNNFAIIEEEGRIAGGYLARLKTQLSDLQLEQKLLRGSAREREEAEASTNAPGSSLPGTEVAQYNSAEKELELLQLQRTRLNKYLKPKHPKMVKLDTDIERAQKLIDIYRRQTQEQLAATEQNIQLKIDSIQASILDWEKKVLEANARIAEAERLRANVQRVQGIYDRLVMLVQNVGISRNIDQETLSILEPASVPIRSFSSEISILAASGFGGLGLGFGLVLLIALRDDRVISLNEVGEKLGQVVVGQVPEVEVLNAKERPALLAANDDRHAYAESFRNLRSALLFMANEVDRPRTILVTSAIPGEGKSTVAANLARALAMGSSRVVLVDCDLRKGVLHRLLELERSPGMAEALNGEVSLDKVVQTNSLSNFSFISAGSPTHHSGDLLLREQFAHILAALKERFDYVIVDTSPVFAADDAASLAPKVDGTLFVVRSRFSRAAMAREALDQLYQRNAKILGVVLNQTDGASRSYYYYKYADYYNKPQTA